MKQFQLVVLVYVINLQQHGNAALLTMKANRAFYVTLISMTYIISDYSWAKFDRVTGGNWKTFLGSSWRVCSRSLRLRSGRKGRNFCVVITFSFQLPSFPAFTTLLTEYVDMFSVLYTENICFVYFARHFLILLEVYWLMVEILLDTHLVLSTERCWFVQKNSV